MSYKIELESTRLICKPIDTSYCTDVYLSWLNDEEVTRYLEIFDPYTEDQLRAFLESAEKNDQLFFWAIHLRENGKHIGNIKIDPVNRRHGYGEYGIMMGDKTEWGKGYAREATELILHFCFDKEKMRKINLGVVKENKPAVDLYAKIGFEVEGIYKKHAFYGDKCCDIIRMAIFNPSAEHE